MKNESTTEASAQLTEQNEADEKSKKAKKKKDKDVLKKLKERGTGFFADFKKFINKGNVISLAIGLAMGSAFTAIVNSLVADLMLPLISIFFGKNNIAELSWHITNDVTLYYGKFLLAVLNFIIVALFLFLIIRTAVKAESGLSKLKKLQKKAVKKGEEPPAPAVVETVKIESVEDILKDIRAILTPSSPSNEPPKRTSENTEQL